MNNLQRLEMARSMQQTVVNKLESQNRSLEVTVATLGTFIQHLTETRDDLDLPGEIRRIVSQINIVDKRRNMSKIYPLKILEDNSKQGLIKSNSGGRDSQNFLRNSNVIDPPYPLKSTLSQPNLATKLERVSSFFSNSHNHIQKQRAQLAALRNEYTDQNVRSNNNDENDPKTVNIDIQITDAMTSQDDNVEQSDNHLKIQSINLEKSISLPLSNAKLKLKPSKSAYELGSVKIVPTSKIEVTNEDSLTNLTGTVHPLDTCSDVNFRYGGTTKLKSIKPVRLSSPSGQGDNVNKNTQNQNTEALNR